MRPGQHRPSLDLTATEFERLIVDLFREVADDAGVDVDHDVTLSSPDGDYQIDAVARFQLMGVDFVVLVECKRHKSPVKREVVAVLRDKIRSLGAQKGILASTSGFQSGAIQYAQIHGIALVDVYDESLDYVMRSATAPTLPPTGNPARHWIEGTDAGYRSSSLDGRPDEVRAMLTSEGQA